MTPDVVNPAYAAVGLGSRRGQVHAPHHPGLVDLPSLLQPALGTVSSNPWISPRCYEIALRMLPGPLSPDSEIIFVVPQGRRIADVALPRSTEVGTPLGPASDVATFVRDVSGLSATALGQVFPVVRETFQRWVSGSEEPSNANLRRLHALASFLSAAAKITPDVRSMLHRPVNTESEETTYDLLVQGKLPDAWNALSELSRMIPYVSFVDAEGDRGVRVTGVPRVGRDATPEEEYDDFTS